MAKFCGKCGSKLDDVTGLCPRCDRDQLNAQLSQAQADKLPGNESENQGEAPTKQTKRQAKTQAKKQKKAERKAAKKEKKKAKKAAMTTKQKVGRFFLKLVALLVVVATITIGVLAALSYFDIAEIPIVSEIVDQCVEKIVFKNSVKQIENAFNDKDFGQVSQLIFPTPVDQIAEEYGLNFASDEENQLNKDGILISIFNRTKVSLERVEDECIYYKVESPNMSGVFNDTQNITSQDELLNYMRNYVNNAEIINFEVSVPYVQGEDGVQIDYQTTEFLNAITGGLLNEYEALYMRALDELGL